MPKSDIHCLWYDCVYNYTWIWVGDVDKGRTHIQFSWSLWIIVQPAQILQIPEDFWYLINMTFQSVCILLFFLLSLVQIHIYSLFFFFFIVHASFSVYHLFFHLFLSHLFPIHLLFGHCCPAAAAPLCHLLSSYSVLVNILDPSDTITVNNKQFQVNIANGLPKVYHPNSAYTLDQPGYTDHAVIMLSDRIVN